MLSKIAEVQPFPLGNLIFMNQFFKFLGIQVIKSYALLLDCCNSEVLCKNKGVLLSVTLRKLLGLNTSTIYFYELK